jgi:hypothetical protein
LHLVKRDQFCISIDRIGKWICYFVWSFADAFVRFLGRVTFCMEDFVCMCVCVCVCVIVCVKDVPSGVQCVHKHVNCSGEL